MPPGMILRDAEALRSYIRLMEMSERALAQAAGIGHATVNHLLSGRRSTCSPTTAQAIESVLACPQGLFFEPMRQRRPTFDERRQNSALVSTSQRARSTKDRKAQRTAAM